MTYRKPARTGSRLISPAALAAVGLVGAVAIGVAVSPHDPLHGDHRSTAATSPAGTGPTATRVTGPGFDRQPTQAPVTSAGNARQVRRTQASSLPAPGVPSGNGTVFDDLDPAVANLDPALLAALRRAATDAADDRITFHVNSGWRSAAYQEQLLQDAIAEYGSAKEAARWVATPQTSAHVSGDAVDLGPSSTERWLSKHGTAYGLCQIYRNEPWHYELRPDSASQGCPAMYADATQDPRMQG